jgi:hypothetical protein
MSHALAMQLVWQSPEQVKNDDFPSGNFRSWFSGTQYGPRQAWPLLILIEFSINDPFSLPFAEGG